MQTITKRKPRSTQKSHRTAIVIVFLAVFLVIGVGIVVFLNRDRIFNTKETSSNKSSETSIEKTDEKQGTHDAEKKIEEKRETEKGSVSQYDGENPNGLEAITGVVSSAGSDGTTVSVRIMLDQILGSSGSCNFTLTHTSGTKLSETVATEAGPSSTFCTYQVPLSNISTGHWQINVKVTATSKEGTINGEMDI